MAAGLESVTELSLVKLRKMPEEEAALLLDGRLRTLEDSYKRSFVERGLILLEMQERQLWRFLVDFAGQQYTSFEDWVCKAAPHSRRDCFYALKAVKELHEIPLQDLREIPRCNIALLQTLSSGIRTQPEVIEAAKALPEKEFLSKMQSDHPAQHIETKRKLIFQLEATAEALILQCLDRVGEMCGAQDREGQLEALAADWIAEHNQ